MKLIDINADLGESFGPWKMGEDEKILDIVSSANSVYLIYPWLVFEMDFHSCS